MSRGLDKTFPLSPLPPLPPPLSRVRSSYTFPSDLSCQIWKREERDYKLLPQTDLILRQLTILSSLTTCFPVIDLECRLSWDRLQMANWLDNMICVNTQHVSFKRACRYFLSQLVVWGGNYMKVVFYNITITRFIFIVEWGLMSHKPTKGVGRSFSRLQSKRKIGLQDSTKLYVDC